MSKAFNNATKLNDFVSVKDFGAKGDGTTDDTAAIQAAWSSCVALDKSLYFPAGAYRVTNTLTEKPVVFIGDNDTAIIFDSFSGKNGITFQGATTPGQLGGIVGMQLIAKGQNGATCIETPKQSDQYSTYYTRWIFKDLYCHGTNRNTNAYSVCWDYGFAKWLRLGDCFGADIENVVIQGQWDIKLDPSGQVQDIGIELDAASAILTARISDITIGPIHTAINIGDKAFFSLETFDLIGTHRGIYQSSAAALNEPKIMFGNINAQDTGIYINNSDSRSIVSVTIRRHRDGWKGGSADWYGIRIENAGDIGIARCTIQPDEGSGAYGGTMTAIYGSACNLTSISGNYIGVGNDRGIHLNNCTGVMVNDTSSAQSNATDVLFYLTANTRITTIGLYELVSTFAGTVLSKDATIVGAITMLNKSFDLQSTSNVVMDVTRVNAATDTKIWRDVTGTASRARQVVSDAGSATNFEIVTRSGTTVSQIEWRASAFKFNQGPTITTGTGTPEGVVTAPIGSLHLRTDGGASTTLYVKQSGTGNTGWVAK
ncbi:MAG: Gordonia phage Sour [Actinomycetota bacterium]